jgi:hypothetical protein
MLESKFAMIIYVVIWKEPIEKSPLELNLGLIQGDFLFGWSFSAKKGHFLQGALLNMHNLL